MTRLVQLAIAWVLLLTGATAGADEVTIYRDTWGVPHIYGESQEAAAFGHGYAQAEDRLEDVLGAWLTGIGRASEAFGESVLDRDRVARIARHEEMARTKYGGLSQETRDLIEAFVAGVQSYMAEHPDDVPPWAVRG